MNSREIARYCVNWFDHVTEGLYVHPLLDYAVDELNDCVTDRELYDWVGNYE